MKLGRNGLERGSELPPREGRLGSVPLRAGTCTGAESGSHLLVPRPGVPSATADPPASPQGPCPRPGPHRTPSRHLQPWLDTNRHPPAPGDAGLTSPRSLCISPARGRAAGTGPGSCRTAAPTGVRQSPTSPGPRTSVKGVPVRTEFEFGARRPRRRRRGTINTENEGGLDLGSHRQPLPVQGSERARVMAYVRSLTRRVRDTRPPYTHTRSSGGHVC